VRQAQRIEVGIGAIRERTAEQEITLRLLESYNDRLIAAGRRDTVLTDLIRQYQRLSEATAQLGKWNQAGTLRAVGTSPT
jgi:hypothetical protein